MSNVGTISGTTYTAPTETGVSDKLIAGIKAPFLADTEVLTSDGAFWAAIEWAFIGSVAGGIFARSRAAKGEEPMLKFLY